MRKEIQGLRGDYHPKETKYFGTRLQSTAKRHSGSL